MALNITLNVEMKHKKVLANHSKIIPMGQL